MSDETNNTNLDIDALIATHVIDENPAQLMLPGMEPTIEDAIATEPVLPPVEVEEPEAEPTAEAEEEASFEPAELVVEEIVQAVEEAPVEAPPVKEALSLAEIAARVPEPFSPDAPLPARPVLASQPEVEVKTAPEPVVEANPEIVPEPTPIEQPEPEVAESSPKTAIESPAEPTIVSEPIAVEPDVIEPPKVESQPQPPEPTPAPEPVAAAPITPPEPVETKPAVAETISATPTPVEPTPEVSNGFAELNLSDDVMAAILRQGYTIPTDIQATIIPHMLAERDVLAQSQTGTGKTAAFALPILSKIAPGQQKPQVLILAPTRELAMQVAAATDKYGADISGLKVTAIYGGSDYGPQLRALKRGVDIVVGTPGRVIDHIKSGKLDLSELKCLVLDEADEMLKMGFLEDVQLVLEHTPETRQVALFSATMPPAIRGIAQHYLNDPARVTIKTKTMTADSIRQRAIFTIGREKLTVLQRILEAEETDGVIVFVKTKESTVKVAEELSRDGLSAIAINGDMPQKVRERTIHQFRKGRLNILVATDVAARGLDVERVSHVFNFDLPHGTESYVHRIGRTGRAGRKGEAIIFLTRSERGKLRQIERVTRQQIEIVDPPTADDINSMRVERYKERITKTAEAADLAFFTTMLKTHAEETGLPMETVAAAVAQMGLGRKSFFLKKDKPKKKREFTERPERGERGDRSARKPHAKTKRDREVTQPDPGMSRYRIAIGWRDGVKPGNIVGAIANEADIDGKAIGHINIQHTFTTVDLPEDLPMEIRQQLYHTRVVGRQMRLGLEAEHLASVSGGGDGRPSRGPRKSNSGGKKYSKSKNFGDKKRKKFRK
jgi:ATP-dependent RNA helicase DeaD